MIITLLIGLLPWTAQRFFSLLKMKALLLLPPLECMALPMVFQKSSATTFRLPIFPPGVGDFGNGYLLYYLPGKFLSWFQTTSRSGSGLKIRELVSFIPNIFICLTLIIFVFWFILNRTQFGQPYLCYWRKCRCCPKSRN